jgi:hypothetical protein
MARAEKQRLDRAELLAMMNRKQKDSNKEHCKLSRIVKLGEVMSHRRGVDERTCFTTNDIRNEPVA